MRGVFFNWLRQLKKKNLIVVYNFSLLFFRPGRFLFLFPSGVDITVILIILLLLWVIGVFALFCFYCGLSVCLHYSVIIAGYLYVCIILLCRVTQP